MNTPTPRWMTPKQTAEYIQVSPRTLAAMKAEKRIPFSQLSDRVVRYDRVALDTWLGGKGGAS